MLKHKFKVIFIFCTCLSIMPSCSKEQNTTIVPPTEDNNGNQEEKPEPPIQAGTSKLWTEFLECKKDGTESTLLDFSYAGYEFGEKNIPDVDYKIYNVCSPEYGAIPNDNKSDREAFEKAIADAVKNGKGIIYFPKGRYNLRPADAPNQPIIIDGDNIILKGDGCGNGGTELFMEYPNEVLDNSLWNTPELISFRYTRSTDKQLTEITGDAIRGSHSITVNSTSGLFIGKRVFLKLVNNNPELIAEELSPYSVESDWTELLNSGVQVTEYHQILRIEGNKVTFKEPIMHKVNAKWGWTLHEHSCHIGVGVEDIAFVGNFHDTFVHHANALHDSGFRPLTLMRQVNAWVRRCRFTDVNEALSVMLSANVSIFSCSITGNRGHSAIRSQASSHIFIGKIDDQPAQYHSVGVSKTSIGAVLWRNKTASNSCFEAHSSQPRATLIDACEGGFMQNHAGGDIASSPNHLSDLVLWNYKETDGAETGFNLWTRNNRYLKPIIAGFHGAGTTFLPDQVTADESHGTAVYPESLYEAQLTERLGALPDWLQQLK